MYDLSHLLLFSMLGILSGARSYRQLHTFFKIRLKVLKKHFKVKWKKPPAYSTIRVVLQNIDTKDLEKAFREYSALITKLDGKDNVFISLDGKVLRGSFDHFEDKAAMQLFSVFLGGQDIILAHETIAENKTNEIPIAQQLIEELELTGCILTLDALHCQKKLSKP